MGLRIARRFEEKRTLEQILLDARIVSEADIANAKIKAESRKQPLGEVLVAESVITDFDLARAYSQQYGIEYEDLSDWTPNLEARNRIPEKVVRRFNVLPLRVHEQTLIVGIPDPSDLLLVDKLGTLIKQQIELRIITLSGFHSALEKLYVSPDADETTEADGTKPEKTGGPIKKISIEDSRSSVEDLINRIITEAVTHRASDIHIEPEDKILRVRCRIDGVLHEIMSLKIDYHSPILSRLKVIAGLDIAEKRNAQDGGFQHQLATRTVDIRLSTLPVVKGEKAVMRILDKSVLRVRLEDLGMPDRVLTTIKKTLESPHGLVLVTGPTGSGKTTTVYSMLNHVNTMDRNIVTVEDPVEFQFEIINQVQVNSKAGLTFAGVLRSILRQDPDIIMVGEIRDQETGDLAIRAALTGHLVISTIHTNDSVSTVTRLVEMGVEPFLVSSALSAIVSQRLIRTLCPRCKHSRPMNESEVSLMTAHKLPTTKPIFEAVGCDACYGYGYKGRQPIFELFVPSPAIRKAISANKSPDEISALLDPKQFFSMRYDGLSRVLDGMTSVEEVLKATV